MTKKNSLTTDRIIGLKEQILPSNSVVRYLYAPGELEGGEKQRATDPIWSLTEHGIEEIIRQNDEPAAQHCTI